MKKVIWFDTETTGVTEACDLVQIAGIIVIDGVVKEEFDIKSRPFKDTVIFDEALKVTQKTKDEIFNYPDPKKSYTKFKNILLKYVNKFDKNDKFWIAGHNINFDFNMLVKWALKNNDKYLGSLISYKDHFDTLSTVKALKFVDKFPKTQNNKLVTLAEALNISFEGMAHDALFDVKATRKLGLYLLRLLSNIKMI